MFKIFNVFNNQIPTVALPEDKKRTEKPAGPLTFGSQKINTKNLAPLAADTVSFGAKKKYAVPPEFRNNIYERIKYDGNVVYNKQSSTAYATRERNADEKSIKDKKWTISLKLANDICTDAIPDVKEFRGHIIKAMSPLMAEDAVICDNIQLSIDKLKSKSSVKNRKMKNIFNTLPARGIVCNREHPVAGIEFRLKDGESLREKSKQKELCTRNQVIDNITDIIGARIIIGDGMEGGAESVIRQITKSVKDGELKIIEAENHTPKNTKYRYASMASLDNLCSASMRRFGAEAKCMQTKNPSGYTAIHLLVEFPDGFKGEIQIIGYDVARFKEVEDLTYKMLQGKSTNPIYKEISEIFKDMTPPNEFMEPWEATERINKRNQFMDYIEAAYRNERIKPPMKKSTKRQTPVFLSLNEFYETYKKAPLLDKDMDFNNIYRLKTEAEEKEKAKPKE